MVKYPRSRARGLLGKAMEERTWRKGEFRDESGTPVTAHALLRRPIQSGLTSYELFVSRVSRRYEKLYSPYMGVQHNKNGNETKSKTKNTIAMQYSYKRTLMYMLCQMLTFFVAAVTYLNLCFV